MADEIKFYAAVNAVKTLADGGIRVYLDLPEDATDIAYTLMECKRVGMVLDFVVAEHQSETYTECNDETEKDPEGSGSEVGGRRIAIRRDKRKGG